MSVSNAEMGVSCRASKSFVPKSVRIKELIKHLDGFYEYNPEFNKGVVLVGISSCLEGDEYRISSHSYTDALVVCDTAEKLAVTMVAPLEKRLSGISGLNPREVRRLVFAQVYWISDNNQATLLLDNYEWFNRHSVSLAFSKLLRLKYGCLTECKSKDVVLKLVKFRAGNGELLMWSYEYAKGKFLMCSSVSGAVIDTEDTNLFQVREADVAKHGRFIVLLTRIKVEDCNTLKFL